MACVAAILIKIIDCHRVATDLLGERLSKPFIDASCRSGLHRSLASLCLVVDQDCDRPVEADQAKSRPARSLRMALQFEHPKLGVSVNVPWSEEMAERLERAIARSSQVSKLIEHQSPRKLLSNPCPNRLALSLIDGSAERDAKISSGIRSVINAATSRSRHCCKVFVGEAGALIRSGRSRPLTESAAPISPHAPHEVGVVFFTMNCARSVGAKRYSVRISSGLLPLGHIGIATSAI
jgi:hypothetical protein